MLSAAVEAIHMIEGTVKALDRQLDDLSTAI